MGLFTKVEDRPTPAAVYNWRVYACAAMAGSAAIMIGYDSAFIGTTLALPSFKHEFHFGELSTSAVNLLNANIVSCYRKLFVDKKPPYSDLFHENTFVLG
jgi:hypothetical protein